MVICFNASKEAKRALDSLVGTGQFTDTSEAISMALVSYEVIQHELHQCATTFEVGGSSDPKSQTGAAAVPDANIAERGAVQGLQVPRLFQLLEKRPVDGDLLSGEMVKTDYKTLSPKDWLFGQWNRFLPAKATSRALFNIMCERHSGIPLNDAANKISYAACDLGDYLRMLDARHGLRREDSLAAAFPSTTHSGAESRLRYGNQFVGTIKQGKFIGLPTALRLVALDSGKDPNLRLTVAGAQFAALRNPVLDAGLTAACEKFAEDEIRFLLQHILSCVPEEVSAFVAVIDAINNGANTPDKMDAFLRAHFDLKDEAAMTTTFLSTQRSGAISRLADLDLIYRQKTGVRVTYTVSHPGKCFRSQIS
jgi:hypothetical protein